MPELKDIQAVAREMHRMAQGAKGIEENDRAVVKYCLVPGGKIKYI